MEGHASELYSDATCFLIFSIKNELTDWLDIHFHSKRQHACQKNCCDEQKLPSREDTQSKQKWMLNLLNMVTSHWPKQSLLYSFWKWDARILAFRQANASPLASLIVWVCGWTLADYRSILLKSSTDCRLNIEVSMCRCWSTRSFSPRVTLKKLWERVLWRWWTVSEPVSLTSRSPSLITSRSLSTG